MLSDRHGVVHSRLAVWRPIAQLLQVLLPSTTATLQYSIYAGARLLVWHVSAPAAVMQQLISTRILTTTSPAQPILVLAAPKPFFFIIYRKNLMSRSRPASQKKSENLLKNGQTINHVLAFPRSCLLNTVRIPRLPL